MKVILTQDVPNLGQAGDVEDVASGYARNYLFPREMAVKATPGALKEYKRRQAAQARRAEERVAQAEEMAEELRGVTLTFEAKAGETGRLYGSVTPDDIAEALAREVGETFDRRKQILVDPLREVGEYTVKVHLAQDVEAEVQVVVKAEDGDEETAKENE